MSRFGNRSYRNSWARKFTLDTRNRLCRREFRFPTLRFPPMRRDSEIAPTAMRGCVRLRLQCVDVYVYV